MIWPNQGDFFNEENDFSHLLYLLNIIISIPVTNKNSAVTP